MMRTWLVWILVPILATVLLGCPKKAPTTTEEVPAPVEEAPPPPVEEVEAPPPAPVEDVEEEGLPSDLEELNALIRNRGLIGDIHFDFDKSDLRSDALDRLAKNASFLREHPELIVTVEGHCDERGTNEYNIALGNRRANAAKDYLSSLGIGARNLPTVSYGEERPVCTQSQESCWWRNRRAHFVVTARIR
jgi:peptidoglycan-associated lipoprotein